MRRAVELNVFFILISSHFHLIITKSTPENVIKNEEEDSTFKSQIDLDDDYRAEQKLGKFSEPNYSENDSYDKTTISSWFPVEESDSGDNQTWPASYDGATELANYTQDNYSLSNINEDPKSGTTARSRWEYSTAKGAQPKFGTAGRNRWEERKSGTTEPNQWGDLKSATTGRNRWEETEFNATEVAQSKFSATGRNRWKELESRTTEASQWGDRKFRTTGRNRKSSTTEGPQPKFSAQTGRNRWEEPKLNTTERSQWEETDFNTTEGTQPKFSTSGRNRWEELESGTTEASQWRDRKFGTTGRNTWEEPKSSTTEGAQPNFNATGRNRWEETEFNTTDEAQPKFSTTGRNRWEELESSATEASQWRDRKFGTTRRNTWEEPKSSTTEGTQPNFNATEINRWEERESNTPRRNPWEETEFNTTDEAQPKFSTTGRNRWEELQSGTTEASQWGNRKFSTTGRNTWEEPKSNTTEGAQPNFNAAGRNRWEEGESNTTGRNLWEEMEFNTTDEAQPKFSTTVRNWWEELEFDTTEASQWSDRNSGTTRTNRWEEPESSTSEEDQPKFSTRWEEQEFGNHTEGPNYTESVTEEPWTPSTETNNISYFPDEEEPTTPRPTLLYRNYGYVNDTKDGWIVTLYDESDTACLKMNLQIVINVYFARNDPHSSLKAASFIQTFPTSSDDLTVEGECNNDTSLVLISWETSNLTWHFDQGENGLWSLREVELSVTNPDWFEKYNFCGKPPFVDRIADSPCHPFSFKSGNGSWYDSRTWCRQVNVPLTEEGTTPLKAVVFLMESFRVEPFARNGGTDFETRVC